jgi:hypothetical protein
MRNVSPTAEPGTAQRFNTRTLDLDAAEQAVIGHMRGWCHDSTVCGLCDADTSYATQRALIVRTEARARTQELRAVDAQIDVAYLTRALAAMEQRALQAEGTLTSIISG